MLSSSATQLTSVAFAAFLNTPSLAGMSYVLHASKCLARNWTGIHMRSIAALSMLTPGTITSHQLDCLPNHQVQELASFASMGKFASSPVPELKPQNPSWHGCICFCPEPPDLSQHSSGCVRGIAELVALQEIQNQLGTGIHIQDFFDLIFGTRYV